MNHNLHDKAMMMAFETIVARLLVPRTELMSWNADAQLNPQKTCFTILFKNSNNTRHIECEVPAKIEPIFGGFKMSVEITMITAGVSVKVPENPWTDVLFDGEKKRTILLRHMIRRRATA